jgi:hypothetical protein
LRLAFRCEGVALAVDSPDGLPVAEALPYGSVVEPDDGREVAVEVITTGVGHELRGGAGAIWAGASMDELLFFLHRELQELVAVHAPDRLFIHAGAVVWRGRGIVLPGNSHAGKTTLVQALLDAGCEHASDEFALLDATGALHPYPRPLRVREPGGGISRVDARRVSRTDVRIGLVLLTEHVAGATLAPTEITPAKAVLGMLAHTVAARSVPGRALDWIARALDGARAYAGPRGEAEDAARWLMDRVAKIPSQ